MNSNPEAKMSNSKRLWTKIVRFFEALEGMDDPMGDYIFSLARRVEKLERDLDHLKKNYCIRAPTAARLRVMPRTNAEKLELTAQPYWTENAAEIPW